MMQYQENNLRNVRYSFVLFILFVFSVVPLAWGQTITLKGTVSTDEEEPIARTRISVSGGFGDDTDDNGAFNINLSKDYISGERVLLNVAKDGWVMNYPLDGEWNLPNFKFQQVHTTRVIMVPKGSKALWTHARIEKHVAQLSDQVTQLRAANHALEASAAEPPPIDFTYHLEEWAKEYGFTAEEVKQKFDRWAAEAQNSTDFRTLGLAAFYQKNFTEAARNFEQAAQADEAALKEIEEAAEQKRLSAFANWKIAGDALFLAYKYDSALVRYTKAALLVNQTDFPAQWAGIQLQIGNAQAELGIRISGERAQMLLTNAISIYEEILRVFSQNEQPQLWAATQNNLGNTLRRLGDRVEGQRSLYYLKQAVEAYQKALTIRTRDVLPLGWAQTQNNLGNVLDDLGTRVKGQRSLDYLQQAVVAFHKALEVRTQNELPQDWAATQNNLGLALRDLGIRIGGQEGLDYLQQAVIAFQKALTVRTRDILPMGWAQTQNNLAEAYDALEQYDAAAQAHTNVLEVYPRYEPAYQYAVRYYHEEAFDYPRAYSLNEQWLTKFPNDLSTRANFAEKQFTTARFSACAKQIESLLIEPELPANNRVALQGIQLANAFATGLSEAEVEKQFIAMRDTIMAQEADFTIQRTFNGTKNFIRQYEELAPYRNWLLTFFDALDQEDRDAILAELAELEESLPTVTAALPK